MFGRIANWWREQKEWRQVHERAFGSVGIPDADGVTSFQRQLMAAVADVMPPSTFQRATMQGSPFAGETYFVADIPGTKMQLFVYPREAGISNPPKTGILSATKWGPYEEWDYRTPDELIAAVVEDVKSAV